MPACTLDRKLAKRIVAAIERALESGAPPPGENVPGRNINRGAIRVVADQFGIDQQVIRGWVGAGGRPNIMKKRFGLEVDWSKFRPVDVQEAEPELLNKQQRELLARHARLKQEEEEQQEDTDPVEIRRLKRENSDLKRLNKWLEERLVHAEDIREGVLGIRDVPPQPVSFPPRGVQHHAETIVCFLSDLQWGEYVDLGEMDGLSSFDLDIARNRLSRWAASVADLATEHWSGPPPDRLMLILGGDLVSGGIHYELAKTDKLAALPSVRDVANHLYEAISYVHDSIGCPIDVISLAGNHGRMTVKPESKQAAETSLDNLVSDFLELSLRGRDGIQFYVPPSPDAVFSVYGWRFVATHGDRIGSRGGQGFVGPAATAARGMKKIIGDYAARGIHIDMVLMGHLHCALELEEGIVNGTLVGPSQYSRDARFRPRPAVQLYMTVHPKRRMSQLRWIEVGDSSEGSLYEPPPVDRPLRPRFRVKAVTTRSEGPSEA